MKRTPLYDIHLALKAKMVEFHGWEMPLYYTDIITEHQAVRKSAGLFDISHMGRIGVEGKDAPELMDLVCTNRASGLKAGEICYALICNKNGGIIDDILVYRLKENFLLVVNAANLPKVLSWISDFTVNKEVMIKDRTEETAFMAIQGPKAEECLKKIIDVNFSATKYYHFKEANFKEERIILSRTGYTGEDGFEVFLPSNKAVCFWADILEKCGEAVKPAGLGSRDTLRLEAGLPLYGHELNLDINPLEAGLGKYVCFEKNDFIGKEALAGIQKKGLTKRLMSLVMMDQAFPRQGYPVKLKEKIIGYITSGSYSPTLKKSIGLGYINTEFAQVGREVEVEVRNRLHRARIVKGPLYKKGKICILEN